jgi:hypothetical protein
VRWIRRIKPHTISQASALKHKSFRHVVHGEHSKGCKGIKMKFLPRGFAAFQYVFRIFVATNVASAVAQVYAE